MRDDYPATETTSELVPRDWQPHQGRHHHTKHGWRPVGGNFACPRCPDKCPDCGSYYAPQGGQR